MANGSLGIGHVGVLLAAVVLAAAMLVAMGNARVHWHLVPLPPGVPYEGQFASLMLESAGAMKTPSN